MSICTLPNCSLNKDTKGEVQGRGGEGPSDAICSFGGTTCIYINLSRLILEFINKQAHARLVLHAKMIILQIIRGKGIKWLP